MPAAAADAPVGNHQVLATKKYVLTNVISQTTMRTTRPIDRDPRVTFSVCPLPHFAKSLEISAVERQTARVYHSSSRAQGCSWPSFFSSYHAFIRNEHKVLLKNHAHAH